MHEDSQVLTFHFLMACLQRTQHWFLIRFLMCWWVVVAAGTGVHAATPAAATATATATATAPLHLGWDVPIQRIDDQNSAFTPDDVVRMSAEASTSELRHPLNAGYIDHTVWLRFQTPAVPSPQERALWLLAEPTYVDSITVYQPGGTDGSWRAQSGGDLVPGNLKHGVRQPLFELTPGQLTLVRIHTTSAMQFRAQVLTSTALQQILMADEHTLGVFFGVLLAMLTGIIGTAMVVRTPQLCGLAVLCTVSCVHVFNVRGYSSLWAPAGWTVWASHAVGMSAFALTAGLAFQIKLHLTSSRRHPKTRGLLNALIAIALLGMVSPAMGLYGSVASLNLVMLALCDIAAIALCVAALRRNPKSLQHAFLLAAYAMHATAGGPIALALIGQMRSTLDVNIVWQAEIFLFTVLVACAIVIEMVRRYRQAEAAKDRALEHLAESEHLLEVRIKERTSELSVAQAALAEALDSERTLRQEQRQFFQMISHEFRTPLTVIDSAAAEQLSFPSAALDNQIERAAQIRRACRRLTSLVDSCLVNDRMEAAGFSIHPTLTPVAEVMAHAAQLVHWSPRHRLHLFTQSAPAQWVCDATLVRIALSNLVDNAVKHAKAGEILITAVKNDAGLLEFSVADDGSGISLDVMDKMFEQFERGDRTDQTRGFGLGLWVARRIARLHGGDLAVTSALGEGTCFTLTLASLGLAAERPRPITG